jgi:hypothetical protein
VGAVTDLHTRKRENAESRGSPPSHAAIGAAAAGAEIDAVSPTALGQHLLARAAAAGLTVELQGERLRLQGPATAETIALTLLAQKPAVLAALAVRETSPIANQLARSAVVAQNPDVTDETADFPRFRVSVLQNDEAGLLAADGWTVCQDCGRRHYGFAGAPNRCLPCRQLQRGQEPAGWWQEGPQLPATRSCPRCAHRLRYDGLQWRCHHAGCGWPGPPLRPCYCCHGGQ